MILSNQLNPIQKAAVKMSFDYIAKRNGGIFSAENSASDKHSNIIKNISEEEREVHLIGNAYNYFDSDTDVLRKNAALKSISERGVNSTGNRKIKFALQHNIKNLTGSYNYLADTEFGIEAKVNIYPDSDTLGRETWLRYKRGDYTEHSIGFNYMQIEWLEFGSDDFKKEIKSVLNPQEAINYGGFYNVKEINLYEISTVTFGANEMSGVLGLKSSKKEIEQRKTAFWNIIKGDLGNGSIDKYIQEIQKKQYDALVLEEHYLKQYRKKKGLEPFKNTLKNQSRDKLTLNTNKKSIANLIAVL